jgi:hypothetical protein
MMDIRQKTGFMISALLFVVPFLVTFLPMSIYSRTAVIFSGGDGSGGGSVTVRENAPPLAKFLYEGPEPTAATWITIITFSTMIPLSIVVFIYTLLFLDPNHRKNRHDSFGDNEFERAVARAGHHFRKKEYGYVVKLLEQHKAQLSHKQRRMLDEASTRLASDGVT